MRTFHICHHSSCILLSGMCAFYDFNSILALCKLQLYNCGVCVVVIYSFAVGWFACSSFCSACCWLDANKFLRYISDQRYSEGSNASQWIVYVYIGCLLKMEQTGLWNKIYKQHSFTQPQHTPRYLHDKELWPDVCFQKYTSH